MYYTSREFRDNLYESLSVRRRDTVILTCAILIASIGLNLNSTVTVIGAMLISPLMAPIAGLGLALALYDLPLLRKSLQLLVLEVGVSLLVSSAYFFLSPIKVSSPELLARTAPTVWDILVALIGGTAGLIGSRQKEANNIVPGVAIATALMPPLCTVSFFLVNGQPNLALGAAQLFLINTVFIMLATLVGSKIWRRDQSGLDQIDLKIRLGILALITVLTIPSVMAAGRLVQDHLVTEAAKQFVAAELDQQVVVKQTYHKRRKQLELTITGQPLSAEQLAAIRAKRTDYGLAGIDVVIYQLSSNESVSREELYQYIDQLLQERQQTQSVDD